MLKAFQSIVAALIEPKGGRGPFSVLDLPGQFRRKEGGQGNEAQTLNAAFLIALSGEDHPRARQARDLLDRAKRSRAWGPAARFYREGLARVREEILQCGGEDPDFPARLKRLAEWVSHPRNLDDEEETAERMWSLFFPEARGVRGREGEKVRALRRERTVKITNLNPRPVNDPAGEILFTGNALLTVPAPSMSIDSLHFSGPLKEKVLDVARERQVYWYDHPVQIGVGIENNEVVYGLRGLDAALAFEKERGNVKPGERLTCVLSVSVTHSGLQGIARNLLQEDLERSGPLGGIDLYVFTETDTARIREEILVPAAARYLDRGDVEESFRVLGVDGEYGRHYSFLKAIAPFWQILINPGIRGTFKIDLDQVFPQRELTAEGGGSAFEHLKTPLWGARGVGRDGRPLDLGMIAGALVNARDLGRSLFSPDVPFPGSSPVPDEYVFYSALPQALSTEAEMMTRYTPEGPDGVESCIQRVHVTGGTNGILVESLRRYRPFTPSFMGRAEDQAYIMSALTRSGRRLAYAHEDGLIMRHDKASFAREAIRSAHIAKLIGDYIRILYFSAYARVLAGDIGGLKKALDPFTGCFISRIPVTVVFLRFALKAAGFFAAGEEEQGTDFIRMGAERIMKAIEFVTGPASTLERQYEEERLGWDLYYDVLSALEHALQREDPFARALKDKARDIIRDCAVPVG
jgi:hypothetical protein